MNQTRSQREAAILDSAQAAALQLTPRRGRPRRRSDRPRFTYRIDPITHQTLHHIKTAYAHAGYATSIDQIADDLLAYAIDHWDRGHVEITVTELQPAARPRSKPANGG